jgi:hypothetical protein
VQVLFRPDHLRILERIREVPSRDGGCGPVDDPHEVRAKKTVRQVGLDAVAAAALLIEHILPGGRVGLGADARYRQKNQTCADTAGRNHGFHQGVFYGKMRPVFLSA